MSKARSPSRSANARRRRRREKQILGVADQVRFVIGIDPASKVTGAALISVATERLICCAKIHSSKDDPVARIREIVADLKAWICDQEWPHEVAAGLPLTVAIAIELPSGRRSARTESTRGAGLTTYGVAAGRVWALADAMAANQDLVILVDERTWTGSRPKGQNLAVVSAMFPQYRAQDDPGADVADAIGIALWAARQISLARRTG